MTQPRFLRALEATSVALFTLQALRVVFSVLFGIIYDQVFLGPPGPWLVVSILLVALAMAAPILSPANPRRVWLAVMASLTALARVALSIDDARVRYWGCLAVLAAGGLYLAGLLTARRSVALPALAGALAADQVLRALGQTYDLSLRPTWIPLQLLWSATIVVVAIALGRRTAGGGRRASLLAGRAALGFGGLLFLETSLLALPNAAARWSGTAYSLLAPAVLGLTLLPLAPRLRHGLNRLLASSAAVRWLLAAMLPGALLVGYFVRGPVGAVALLLAHLAALGCLSAVLDGRPSKPRPVGAMLALGLVFVLALNVFNAFAFTYPYAVPAMRGLGWLVYLIAALAAGAGMLAQRPVAVPWNELATRTALLVPAGLIMLGAVTFAVWPRPTRPLTDTGTLRLATYNIHYGYDKDWHFTLPAIADTLEREQVDVAALQEVDTGRLTSYAVDDAYFLARRLGMNVAYLPTVEHLTGIALLYRGPASEIESRLLTSREEQTGILRARLRLATGGFDAFGVWMGLSNEETGRQIREALAFIGDRAPAAFGGDFNASDGGAVTRAVVQAGFVDPFAALGILPIPLTDPAVAPTARIDYVWLRGLTPRQAWVSDSLASDHRMVVIEVAAPP